MSDNINKKVRCEEIANGRVVIPNCIKKVSILKIKEINIYFNIDSKNNNINIDSKIHI